MSDPQIIRLPDVAARIAERVPALAGRLDNAGQFSQVIEQNLFPQQSPWGFVLPGGLAGGSAEYATGLFVQSLVESVIVVLLVQVAGDPFGGKALDEVTPLVRDVVFGVVGWGPDDAPGVFVLRSAELTGSMAGWIFYEVTFALDDQLRIDPT
jgi:hypothetical protein